MFLAASPLSAVVIAKHVGHTLTVCATTNERVVCVDSAGVSELASSAQTRLVTISAASPAVTEVSSVFVLTITRLSSVHAWRRSQSSRNGHPRASESSGRDRVRHPELRPRQAEARRHRGEEPATEFGKWVFSRHHVHRIGNVLRFYFKNTFLTLHICTCFNFILFYI